MREEPCPLIAKLNNKTAHIGIIGLGYVGLPLLLRYVEAGYRVLGFDIDPDKVTRLHRAVNIGLVNEMKIVADRMGIDIHEVGDSLKWRSAPQTGASESCS